MRLLEQFWNINAEKHYISVVDIEGIFRIIKSIPSKNAELIKQWLVKFGLNKP